MEPISGRKPFERTDIDRAMCPRIHPSPFCRSRLQGSHYIMLSALVPKTQNSLRKGVKKDGRSSLVLLVVDLLDGLPVHGVCERRPSICSKGTAPTLRLGTLLERRQTYTQNTHMLVYIFIQINRKKKKQTGVTPHTVTHHKV